MIQKSVVTTKPATCRYQRRENRPRAPQHRARRIGGEIDVRNGKAVCVSAVLSLIRLHTIHCFWAEIGRLEGNRAVTCLDAKTGRDGRRLTEMTRLLLCIVLTCTALSAKVDPLEGLWQGYEGEWGHVSRQLVALAEAIPADKYSWRPAKGVRSTSEVFMHVALANFSLLSVTGPPTPPDMKGPYLEKTVTAKPDVIQWLKRSLDAVKMARAGIKPGDLQRKVKIANRDATVDGMYLRIIVHANEHMGQLIAYARVNGIVPPWSERAK